MGLIYVLCLLYLIVDLDVSPLVLEVDPGVRVAPDERREEQPGERDREEHEDEPDEAGVAQGHQRHVIRAVHLNSVDGTVTLLTCYSSNQMKKPHSESLFRDCPIGMPACTRAPCRAPP